MPITLLNGSQIESSSVRTHVLLPGTFTSSISNGIGFLGTSSYSQNSNLLDGLDSTVFITTGSNTFIGNQIISGSLTVVTGSGVELLVTNTGVTVGNALTDIHNITGSLRTLGGVTGSFLGTASWASSASVASNVGPGTSQSIALFNSTNSISSSIIFQSGSNIGIGTTSPAYRLQVGTIGTGVQSGIYVPAQFNWDGAYLQQATSGGRGAALTLAANVNTLSSSAYRISTDNDSAPRTLVFSYGSDAGAYASSSFTELIRLDRFGNFGIGNTNPQFALDISGSTGVRARIIASGLGTSGLILSSAGATVYTIKAGNGDSSLRIDQDGTDRITVASGGNVGIGITSPTALLHVSGANNTTPVRVSIGNNATYNFSGNSTSGYITTFNMDDVGSSLGHNSSFRDLQLRTNSTARLTILGGGNVGIGTTSPSSLLHVQGNVSASSYTSSISNAVGFFGTSSWATSASVASGFTGTANRVLYNNASNVTTTSANLTFDGTNLTVGGQLNASTKSFLINHRTKPGKKLVYGVAEGPEHSVFIRGRLKGTNTIVLPNEWDWLVDLDSITVQLTPIGKHQKLFVKNIDKLYITVENGGFFSGPVDCYYFIQATRKDVDPLQTVV